MCQAALKISPNIITFLPRTVDMKQLEGLSRLSCPRLGFEVYIAVPFVLVIRILFHEDIRRFKITIIIV